MAATDSDPSSVLDAKGDAFSPTWSDFLSQPEIGVSTLSATASDGHVSCTFSDAGLWGYVFDSQQNSSILHTSNVEVGDNNTVALGLQSATKKLSLVDVLKRLGVTDSNGALPNDDGSFDQTATTTSSLIKSVLNDAIKPASSVVPDTTQPRNAIWFSPGATYRTDVALTYVLAADETGQDAMMRSAVTFIQNHFNFDVLTVAKSLNLRFIAQQTWTGLQVISTDAGGNAVTSWQVLGSYAFTIQLLVDDYIFSLTLRPRSSIEFSFTNPTSSNILSMLNLNTELPDSSFKDLLSPIEVLWVSGMVDRNGTAVWSILIGLTWSKFAIYLQYDSARKTFTGGLITDGFYTTEAEKTLVSYDPSRAIMAPKDFVAPPFYDIRDLSTEFQSLSSSLPTAIMSATLLYQTTPAVISFSATLIAPSQTANSTSKEPKVPSPFIWDELGVTLTKSSKVFACDLAARFTLTDGDATADLGLVVSYSTPNWQVLGYAQNLTGAMLTQFFDSDFKEALNAVLGRLQIVDMQVVYMYGKDDQGKSLATSFAFTGTIQLGNLQLRLFYQYASSRAGQNTAATATVPQPNDPTTGQPLPPKPVLPSDTKVTALAVKPGEENGTQTVQTDWSFECDLGAAPGTDTNLGDIIDSIIDGGADSLPSFVTNIKMPEASSDKSLFSIKVSKASDDAGKPFIVFALRITLESFTFTFAQVGHQGGTPAKQILRFSVDPIPMMKDIPVISTLPQPFDLLEYMWVNDAGGILQSEADALNRLVLSGQDSLYFKQPEGQGADQTATATNSNSKVVLAAGHHFIVIRNNAAVIDHLFAASKQNIPSTPTKAPAPTPTPTNSAVNTGNSISGNAADPQPPPPSPPTKGTVDISLGPLSIGGVALQYKENGSDKLIGVTMNATFQMGPISFELIGFGFEISVQNITLKDFSKLENLQVFISGLSLGFNKPPLLIAGGFEHDTIGTEGQPDFQDIYLGGIGISWPPYTFVGLGEYAILNDYKSVFLYAKLDGPLITLEFATISGIRLGFGYNSMVRSPSLAELTSFPFIDDSDSKGTNPLDIVKNMTQGSPPWVQPYESSYWLAAGMSISAFDVLTITALAMLGFRDNGVIISLYADAVAQMPPDATDKSEMIVYVEIAMVAEMNTVDGYFRVEAALAPTSFLLTQDCHLYGGFALVYWFGSNPHAGDWVFSVGGYHPAYDVPEWYPVVQRLGISWSPGACMSVTGESYFAVTPKVAMGGAMLKVTLSVGPVSAWLVAGFDCLINFHPLHYQANFHVSIGVECDIDIWFIHIHISVTVGAFLTVQGPEFGGMAHVDFYLFGFDVDFGASPGAKDPLSLLQFWETLHKPGPQVTSQDTLLATRIRPLILFDGNVDRVKKVPKYVEVDNGDDGNLIEGAAFKYVLEDGNFPQSQRPPDPTQVSADGSQAENTGVGARWFVKGGTFKFRISTDMALSQASVSPGDLDDDGPAVQVPSSETPKLPVTFYSRPMKIDQAITSELHVDIYITPANPGDPKVMIGGWQHGTFDVKSVPQAMFGQYSADMDPTTGATGDLLTHDNATMPLGMGLKLEAPPPRLALSLIPVFKASDMGQLEVGDFRFRIPQPEDYAGFYLPQYEPMVKPDFTKTTGSPDNVLTPVQTLYLSSELTQTEQNDPAQQRWDEVGDQWVAFAQQGGGGAGGQTDALIKNVESIFGWQAALANKVAAAAAAATTPTTTAAAAAAAAGAPTKATSSTGNAGQRQPWQLTGAFPKKLVRSTNKNGVVVKNLEASYLSLPRVAVLA